MHEAIQIKISLDGAKPSIWRRILVSKETSFFQLHHIIQIVMGWANYHLFEFKIAGYRIGIITEEFKDMGFGNDQLTDCRIAKLTDIISGAEENFKYYYDFGDSWTHTITIEKLVSIDASLKVPVCLKGKLNCPPEDCGGIPGFYNFLKIISNKKNREYKETLEWIGGYYDPNQFNIETINRELGELDEYIKEWEEDIK